MAKREIMKKQKAYKFSKRIVNVTITALCGVSLALTMPLHRHVLVISIDGLGPDYVTKAYKYHLKIPTLRRFLKEGTYADGVVGVIPTLTYPSHTTLVTGVWPAEHGVYNNQEFDPLETMHGKAITESGTIRVETLWDAAHAARYTTASVGWPVTTGSRSIDYLLPANAGFERSQEEQQESVGKSIHYDRPAGLRDLLEKDMPGNAKLSIDKRRFNLTLEILKRYKPEFMTTHLGELDHAEHVTGPFSETSLQGLEFLDGEVAQLISVEHSIDPEAYIVIVSDHGFEPVEKVINLGILLVQGDLIHLPKAGSAESWEAACWNSGGTTAIMLKDPSNQAMRAQVENLLKDAARNPEYGIARILSHEKLVKRGGNPDAAFVVETKPGYAFGPALDGKVVVDTPHRGNHGFLPDRPELRSSFLYIGPGVAKGRDLGLVDMRQIAPTIAHLLGIQLPAAKQPPLRYK
jgi:predicted AlkP superfamily pyrophosphatase or phosphodiesterase